MKTKVVRFRFETKVHFGTGGLEKSQNIVYADTLFSSMFLEAMKLGVSDSFYSMFDKAGVRISDALPFISEQFYVPRPFIQLKAGEEPAGIKKKVKNLKYIPIQKFSSYLKGEMDAAKEESYFHNKFGRYSLDEKVSMLNAAEDENLLYAVKSFQYGVDAGLYICIRYEKEEEYSLVWKLLHSLSYGGLGGKLSSGYGKFHLEEVPDEETKIFEAPLDVESSAFKYFMALSMCLPREMEMERSIEKAFFQLMKRGGFISTKENSNSNRKKQTIYMIVSGSVFRKTFEGMICDVSAGGMHPVYRYGKPLFMGVY